MDDLVFILLSKVCALLLQVQKMCKISDCVTIKAVNVSMLNKIRWAQKSRRSVSWYCNSFFSIFEPKKHSSELNVIKWIVRPLTIWGIKKGGKEWVTFFLVQKNRVQWKQKSFGLRSAYFSRSDHICCGF